MPTTQKTDTVICAELDDRLKIKRQIYYDVNALNNDEDDDLKYLLNRLIYFKEYEVRNSENRLELLFHFNPGKQMKMYIPGPSGVGKSYLTAQFMKEYVRRYVDRKVYFFSQVPEDRVIDNVVEEHDLIERNVFVRIDLNMFNYIIPKATAKKKINVPPPVIPSIDDFRRSLCIFDDIDEIPNLNIRKNIDAFKDEIIATGRDHSYQGNDIDIIITNHQILGGVRTSKIVQQSNFVVLFPQGLSSHGIKITCSKYLGIDQEQINKILSLNKPYQYAIVHRDAPSFVLEQKKIWLIK